MPTIKVSELTNLDELDSYVAQCEEDAYYGPTWSNYSTDWRRGGPIIEREKITTYYDSFRRRWTATIDGDPLDPHPTTIQYGLTPLTAAMRCYVAHKLGADIEEAHKTLHYLGEHS